MEKLWSLIKATMSSDMALFKIKTKNKSKSNKIPFVLLIFVLVFFAIYSYGEMFMEPLANVHLEYVLLTLFVLITSVMTIMEGIYKSGSLIFNCKDDNLLLSLPIKKSTVIFIRIFKFYVFELVYNSLFLAPAMLVYIRHVSVDFTFYLVSFIALLLLPIIPIIISCLIGGVITHTSSKFKFKNIAQIIITAIFLLFIIFLSFNIESILNDLGNNASNINDTITKLYYPAGAYIKLVTNFNILSFLLFILIHVVLFVITILILSKVYFKINSNMKVVNTVSKTKKYTIKSHSKMVSLIKKELNRFINSPVFVTNAAFGLVLHVVISIVLCFKVDYFANLLVEQKFISSVPEIYSYIAVLTFGLICFSSLMSNITSSMISLEGKSFIILKSLPLSPKTILFSKVITATLIMIPFILIGDIILFIKFNFNIIEIILLLLSSVLLPLVTETIGILVNLKYPNMTASNDTEVVKQSLSTLVAVLIGMLLVGITVALLVKGIFSGINNDLIIFIGFISYVILYSFILMYLSKKGLKDFDNIIV